MKGPGRNWSIEVLVVSGDEDVRRIVEAELTRQGDALHCRCVSPEGMLSELAKRMVDAVVLDAGRYRHPVPLVTLHSRFPRLPVVAISPTNDVALSLLDAGAADFLYLPLHGSDSEIDQFGTELASRVRIAAMALPQPVTAQDATLRVVAIAAAKGGPVSVSYLLCQLPMEGPPVLILQHHARAYSADFARTLSQMCGRTVRAIDDTTLLEAGMVYLYTGNRRPQVLEGSGSLVLKLGLPARCCLADQLFLSLAALPGGTAAGVLLPCPGCGGCTGLQALSRNGGWAAWMDRNAVLHEPHAAVPNDVRALPLEDIAAELDARIRFGSQTLDRSRI